MATATFNFSFRNCDSFLFEDSVSSGSITDKTLTITFPDGNVLTFIDSDIVDYDLEGIVEDGYLGYDGHEILADLDEWGFSDSTKKIVANIDSLTEDIENNPSMFKDSDGNNTSFTYTYFPSGVYKVIYSYEDADIGSEEYTKYVQYADTANLYLKEKIEWLFTNDTEQDTTDYQYNLIKDAVTQMIMLIHIADFDFRHYEYIECNLKLTACDRIYSTGVMSYKYDEGR